LTPIAEFLFVNAVRIDKVCKKMVFRKLIEKDNCMQKKQNYVVEKIEEVCVAT